MGTGGKNSRKRGKGQARLPPEEGAMPTHWLLALVGVLCWCRQEPLLIPF